jgi:hypothetical protein
VGWSWAGFFWSEITEIFFCPARKMIRSTEEAVLACLCLDSNLALDRPMMSTLRPSDHPVLLSSLLLLCNSSDESRNWTVSSSDGVNFVWPVAECTNYTDAMHRRYRWFIRRCHFFSFSSRLQLGSLLQLNILNMPSLIASKYDMLTT